MLKKTTNSPTLPLRRVLLPRGYRGSFTPLQVLEWVAYELDSMPWTAETCQRIATRLSAAGFAIREQEASAPKQRAGHE